MNWRVAECLEVLLKQLNEISPNRDKSWDGSIGDQAHASRRSDHNPWVMDGSMGIVTARDFTNDPAHGISSQDLAERLVASRDERIKYVISNKRICSGTEQDQPAWVWREYHGVNPHDHHCHVSVKSDKFHYDSGAPWRLDIKPSLSEVALPRKIPPHPILKRGAEGKDVSELQNLLNAKGYHIAIDGDFGPATQVAVRQYQVTHKLVPDGVAGPYTWKSLET